MTDKTIIDGVDVSGCGFYQRVFEKPDRYDPCNQWGDTRLIFCSENPNCDYKQSARKDERIKKLEHLASQMTCKVEKLAHENGELKQKLLLIAELANQIINTNDKPACVHEPECPSNGGIGYDNHCHMTCPFIIAQQIKQTAQGE